MKLVLGYRGTRFAGWATQDPAQTGGRPTVQGSLEQALGTVLGHPVRTVAAGRTDAGVHAEGQVVSFDTTSPIPAEGLVRALAARLPEDLWAVDAAEERSTFDARRSARRRWYRYVVWRGRVPSGCWQGRCLAHPDPLDLPAMRAASAHLLGRRDVATLAGGWGRDGRRGRSTVRTIYAADWLESHDEPLLLFDVCADGFLRQMVRTMVGSLLWVGRGRWTPEAFRLALAAVDRRAAGPTAPAAGLTLWKIEYDPLPASALSRGPADAIRP